MSTRSGTQSCPDWCIAHHFDADETLHYGVSREISVISRETREASRSQDQHAFAVDTLVLVQHQESHERGPWLALLLRGGPLLDITVDSARRLGAGLLDVGER